MACEGTGVTNPNDLFSLDGTAAVVTGGTSGIGRMIAGGLVAAGARTYVASRKADACEQTAAELAEVGECTGIPADLSTEAGCEGLAAAVAEREDRLHLLVNNAGATWGAPLEEYPDRAFDKLWAVNVKGVFHLTRLLLPQLRAAATAEDPARVVNIGSVDGIRVPVTENYAYSASKAAVHMLTRHLAQNLASDHITVNAIAPGPFDSRMMAFVLDDPAGRQMVASSVPLGRVGQPDDVAGAVVFLASRAGAYLTGAIIPVDGGISAG
jgi:NAD(P)-dependent dehydrogenase (short-subunit alcohol dehydrogenase family)